MVELKRWTSGKFRVISAFYIIIIITSATGNLSASTNSHAIQGHTQTTLSQQYIEDATIYLSASLLIGTGEELIIQNSTIIIIQDQVSILVRTGGALSIFDSLLYSEEGCSWGISSESNAKLEVIGSTLIGAGTGTVPPYCGISIRCDDAIVSNCTISGFSADGIHIADSRNVHILHNNISASAFEGIDLGRVYDSTIIGNQISNTGYCGIFATVSVNITISNNTISSTRYSGVCLDHTEQSVVRYNELTYNGNDCVSLEFCANIIVEDNLMAKTNASGVGSIWSEHLFLARNNISAVVYSGINLMIHTQDVKAVENIIYNSSSDGMAASSCKDILFSGNYIDTINLSGFEIVNDCENITVMLNTVIDCGSGVNIVDSKEIIVFGNWVNESYYHDIHTENSNDGIVYMNAFCTQDIEIGYSSISNFQWDNETMGNFWADYDGHDDEGDGIGDSMYVISYGEYDFCPLMSFDLIVQLRDSYNILSGMWYEEQTTSTTTTTDLDNSYNQTMNGTEMLLIANSSIQLVSIVILLVVARKKYL